MKKYLINIIVFFVIVIVIDVAVGSLGDYLQAHSKGGDTKRTDDLVIKDYHDIIVLGSSRAHCHYDTPFMSDILGLDVYNAGYDGCGVVLAYGLLELILERYQPKLVVFDVEPSFDINVYEPDNNHVRYLGPLKPYYRHSAIGQVIKDVSLKEWYKVNFGLIRYNSALVPKAIDCFSVRGEDLKGYNPEQAVYTGIIEQKTDSTGCLDEFKLKYLDKLCLLAQSHGVPIIFIASPKLGVPNSKVFSPVKEICCCHEVPFIDYYSDPIFQKTELFCEPMHLNFKGARLFSATVINDIMKYID